MKQKYQVNYKVRKYIYSILNVHKLLCFQEIKKREKNAKMAARGLLISYILPFYVQLLLLLCYQVHFPLNPVPIVMIYKKQFPIICCMFYSSSEKTKSRVTFVFPTPLN